MGAMKTIPPRVMRELRMALPPSSTGVRNYRTQGDAAQLLSVTKRTVSRWELQGGPVLSGWAYVGVAYRIGRAAAAQDMIHRLSQLELEGAAVWGRADS